MNSLAVRSWRRLARLLAARPPARDGRLPGLDAALDGATATAVAESAWCDVGCLGATFPASVAARAFARRAGATNAFGAPVRAIETESGPGALAAALGAAESGLRASAFLAGPDLAACGALLQRAAGRRTPIVVHVAARALPGAGVAFGGGHEAWHAASDAGWMQLFASNAQEAVDLALAARLAAERSLVPVMIGIDGPETALAAQDVRLPDPALVRELLGPPAQRIAPPTPAQRLVFGEHRERVPRWHDLDEAATIGGAEPVAIAAASRAAGDLFFAAHAEEALAAALAQVAERTGRALDAVSLHAVRDAELLVVAIGAAVETARVAADRLRAAERRKIGVLGVSALRPWPTERLRETAAHAKGVLVLERAAAPLAAHGPLAREVLGALADLPAPPRLTSAVHGLGGVAASPALVAEACRRALAAPGGVLRLGIGAADDEADAAPARRVVLDAVRREYPSLASCVVPEAPDATPGDEPGALRIAVCRAAGPIDEPFAGEVAALLHALRPGRLRTLPAMDLPVHGAAATDLLSWSDAPCTPSRGGARLAVLVSAGRVRGIDPLASLVDGGTLLVPVDADGRPAATVDAALLARADARSVAVVGVPVPRTRADERPEPAWRRHEALLGALAAAALPELSATKIEAAHRATLDELDDATRDAHLDAFRAGAAGAAPRREAPTRVAEPGLEPAAAAPAFGGHPVKSPQQQWTRVGALVDAGRAPATAEPFAACAAAPAGSSARRTLACGAEELVEFEPERCDGTAAPWLGCPDGSVQALALPMQAILEAGVELAAAAGRSADALGPLLGRIAKAAHAEALAAVRPPVTVREAVEGPGRALVERAATDPARRATLDEALGAVLDAVGLLPIARTPALFDALEQAKPGSGAFLVIGVDPDACRDARAAAASGVDRGLRVVARSPAHLERARMLQRIFAALPDTPGAIVAHAAAQPAIGPMGAALLARGCGAALATGDDAEPGSGARLALRLALAACEAEVQPRVQRFLEQLRGVREKIASRIHDALAGALPDTDLDALAQGLRALGREDATLADLGARVRGAAEAQRIDVTALGALVEAGRALADVEWRLAVGPTGAGRARLGAIVAVGPGTLWAASAPFTPFLVPVAVEADANAAERARGIAEGQAAAALDAVRCLRFARAVLDRPAEAERERARLATLTWADVAPEEDMRPPVLLIGDDVALARGALGAMLWLLAGPVPVKVVLLSGGGAGADPGSGVESLGAYPAGNPLDLALLAVLGRRAFVAQSSLADPDHLDASVRGALRFAGPALVRIHAPSPARHGFPATRTLEQAHRAVISRTFPLFRFDPAAGGVFGSCLDLNGNPEPNEVLAHDAQGRPVTPLDWAITELRFRPRFAEAGAGADAAPAAEAMTAEPGAPGATAATVVDPFDRRTWVADATLVSFAIERVRAWRTLQELAGLVTPFTRRVREDAEHAVAAAHARAIDDLRRDHEAALASLRAEMEAGTAERLRDGLLALAGYGAREGDDA